MLIEYFLLLINLLININFALIIIFVQKCSTKKNKFT